jgi:DNA (cytosine-5)-methyltransferase 1
VSQAHGRKLTADSQPDLFGEVLPNEVAERSRATMWDVLRFAEYHNYKGGIVENVVQERNWSLWPVWLKGLETLGYSYKVVYMNSMYAQAGGLPAPQSRDRLYVVYWKTKLGRKPNFDKWTRPFAVCGQCGKGDKAVQAWKRGDRPWGKYREQYIWRCQHCTAEVFPAILPAAAAIDWSMPGQKIGDRPKALSPKTMARIVAGLKRYAQPVHLEAAGNTYEHGSYIRAWPVEQPFRTMHTSASKGIAWPPMLVPAGGTWNDTATSVNEPMRARTTRENEALVTPAMLMRNNSTDNEDQSWPCTPVDDPMRTLTTAGHQTLIQWGDVDWPTQAMVLRGYTPRGDPGQMTSPVTQPLRTQTASGSQFLIRWDHLIYRYDTENGYMQPVSEPLPTQTTIVGDGLLAPDVDVDKCEFRMLEPKEVKWGMAFPREYLMKGTRREQIKLAGQAVTPPAARDLVACVTEAITGEEIDLGFAA